MGWINLRLPFTFNIFFFYIYRTMGWINLRLLFTFNIGNAYSFFEYKSFPNKFLTPKPLKWHFLNNTPQNISFKKSRKIP